MKAGQKKFNERGEEILDSTPMAVPVGFKRPPTLQEQIARAVRSEQFRAQMESLGMETFAEADDFDVGEDFDPKTPYEMEFDPDLGKEITHEMKQHLDRERAQFDQFVKEKQAEIKRRPKVKEEPKKRAPKKEEFDSEED